MKGYFVSLLALVALISLLILLVTFLFSGSVGEFLHAAPLPLLILFLASYTAGSFPSDGNNGRPAIP